MKGVDEIDARPLRSTPSSSGLVLANLQAVPAHVGDFIGAVAILVHPPRQKAQPPGPGKLGRSPQTASASPGRCPGRAFSPPPPGWYRIRPVAESISMASGNAPTPGRMSPSARRRSSASRVIPLGMSQIAQGVLDAEQVPRPVIDNGDHVPSPSVTERPWWTARPRPPGGPPPPLGCEPGP